MRAGGVHPGDRRARAQPVPDGRAALPPHAERRPAAPLLDVVAGSAVDAGRRPGARRSTPRSARASRRSCARARPCTVHAAPPAGARPPVCSTRSGFPCSTISGAGVRSAGPRRARGGGPGRRRRATVRATYAASAGSRRGSIAHTTTSASRSPASVATATSRPPRRTRSRASVPGIDRDPTGGAAGRRARRPARPSRPAGVQAPKRCSR